MILRRNRLEMAIALACGAASIGMPAWAGTYMVTTLEDSGPGSLRQAVLDANADVVTQSVINFQTGLTGTITLNSGELPILAKLIINGPGASVLSISGNDQSRIFNNTGPGVTISNLTLTGGNAEGCGGAIYNGSIMVLKGLVVSRNTASEEGGGICSSGILNLADSTIAANTSNQSGGGIAVGGMAIIRNSILSGNVGGGLWTSASSTLVVNSTIVGNRASGNGGGVYVYSGATTLEQCTVSLNIADSGGGFFQNGNNLTISNSIIAGNMATERGSEGYHSGNTLTLKGVNLFGQYGAHGLYNTEPRATDIILTGGTETLFTNESNNGGPTQTLALAANSPAIDAGDNSIVPAELTTDQRGEGFARIVGEKVDIGAFEYGNTGNTTPQFALTVTKTGGNGTVTSTPKGITCGDVCSAPFDKDTAVTLTAKPDAGNSFAGWSGDCTNTTGTCKVTMNAAKAVTALFSNTPPPKTYKLTTTKTGLGTIAGAGEYAAGATVKLTAKPSTGYRFDGWKPTPCAASFKMPAKALTCIAQFTKISGGTTYTLAVKAEGPGTVKGAGKYAAGATVKLTATPKEGATFVGWNPSPCAASFRMPAKALTCTATFEKIDDGVENFPSTDDTFPKGWTTPSDSTVPWEVSGVDPAYEGTYTLTSGLIYDSQKSSTEVSGTFEAGTVQFAVRVSSEKVGATNGDALRFSIDGIQKDQWSGEMDWKAASYPLTAGPHTLRWSYEKDSAKTAGKDQAWVDDVILPKGLCGAGCEVWPQQGKWPVGFVTDNVVTPWIIDDSTETKNPTFEGRYTLRSAVINNSQSSSLSVEDTFPAGTVKFARRVSSEKGYDFLRFTIDGVKKGEWSGEEGWSEFSYPLTAGKHKLVWTYIKGRTGAAGKDMAWIDSVVLPGR